MDADSTQARTTSWGQAEVMTRQEVAATLGCGAQRRWVWTSAGAPVAIVLSQARNPAAPDRVGLADTASDRVQAAAVAGLTLPVFTHDGRGAYLAHGPRRVVHDASDAARQHALDDAGGTPGDVEAFSGLLRLDPVGAAVS